VAALAVGAVAMTTGPSASGDNYSRMKDCTARVDQLAERHGWATDRSLLARESHYNAQRQRCYVKLTLANLAAKEKKELPGIYYELWDAFEEKLLALCTDESTRRAGAFCTVQDKEHFRDCGYCRSFVKDRMTK
jgi:hypothetical protein